MLQMFAGAECVMQGIEVIFDDGGRKGHIITELCDGGSLQDRVDSQGFLPSKIAANYLQTLAEFAMECHSKGMLELPISKPLCAVPC